MTGAELSARLRGGECAFGTLAVADSPLWPQAILGAGAQMVFLDTEHIPIDRHALSWMCRSYATAGLPPLVRVPSPDPAAARMALDGGAWGIVAPYLEEPQQVLELVGAVKHAPLKGAYLQEALAGSDAAGEKTAAYIAARNRERFVLANIESVPALERLDELTSVPGLDGVLVGPHDLSVSMGIPEEYGNPRFRDAVTTIVTTARARGLTAGYHQGYPGGGRDFLSELMAAGANLIIYEADVILLSEGLRIALESLKEAAHIAPSKDADGTEPRP